LNGKRRVESLWGENNRGKKKKKRKKKKKKKKPRKKKGCITKKGNLKETGTSK